MLSSGIRSPRHPRSGRLGLLLSLLLAPSLAAEPRPAALQEVAPGVHAALQPHGERFNDSNSVVLVRDDEVLVVDSQADPAATRRLIEAISRLTDAPVTTLVNTHWHPDHTQTNQLYREAWPEIRILGHETLLEDVPGRAAPQLEEQLESMRRAVEGARERLAGLEGEERRELQERIEGARARIGAQEVLEPVPPTRTVDDKLILPWGEGEIRILHRPGHTRGDLVLFLPRERILVSGDLVDDLPYGGHGYPRRALASLESLEALDFEVLIPGHGGVRRGNEAREHLRLIRELHESIVTQVEAAVARGLDLEATLEAVDLEPFRHRLAGSDPLTQRIFDDFMPPTVERAWLEARGELPD